MSSRSILGFLVGAIVFIVMIFACVFLYRWINPPDNPTQPAAPVLPSPIVAISPQPNIYNTLNQVINYTYAVSNNGTTRLTGPVTVTDNKVPNVICPNLNSVGNNDGNFDVGEKINCTATYTITQADLDNTFMTDTATASAGGLTSLPATATIKLNPVLSLTASTNLNAYCQAGQNISFTYTITNTGTAALGPAQFIVRNDHIPSPINCGANNTTLATNQSVSCNTVYTTTTTDASATQLIINSVASGGGAGSIQQVVSTIPKNCNTGPTPVSITPGAMVTHVVTPGDWLLQISRCYGASFPAVRTANPQIIDPNEIYPSTIVKVPNVGSAGTIYGPPCMIWYTVVSGDTWQSIADKNNADIDILKAANPGVSLTPGVKIKVPVNSKGGPPVTPVPTGAPPSPLLKLTVTSNPGSYTAAGQILAFNYLITNIGTTNLGPAQFSVQDTLIPNIVCPANVTLASNQSTTCNASYTTTQADVTAGKIVSNASAAGAGATTPQATVTTILYSPLPPPVSTAAPQPIRLTFPGSNPSNISQPGTITTPGTIRYVFAASAGQTLTAQLIVSTNDVNLAIYGPNNTTVKGPDTTNTWSGTLPLNGDYFVDLISSVGVPSKNFTLNLTLATTAPPSNTVRVADINPGATSSSPSWLSPFNAQLYFQANGNADTGAELWKYDLAPNTASLVADIFKGPTGSNPTSLRPYQNMLYFGADGNDGAGTELWRFNGSGVGRVTDIYAGAGSSNPMYMTEFNGELYFSANGNNGAGIELWKFNGSNSGTSMAYDINPGPGDSKPSYLTVYKNLLYFAATTTDGGTELWKFDGTKATLASDIAPGAINSSPAFLAVFNDLLYFSADGNNGAGNELWKFDGTNPPSMAYDINPGPAGSAPTYLTQFNTALFFGAVGNSSGFELWKFDGTTPSMAADINKAGSSNPAYLSVYSNELYFQADGGDGAGIELWKYKGP